MSSSKSCGSSLNECNTSGPGPASIPISSQHVDVPTPVLAAVPVPAPVLVPVLHPVLVPVLHPVLVPVLHPVLVPVLDPVLNSVPAPVPVVHPVLDSVPAPIVAVSDITGDDVNSSTSRCTLANTTEEIPCNSEESVTLLEPMFR